MKPIQIFTAALLSLLTPMLCLTACGQGTGFTYQGRLDSSGSPVHGTYDLTLTLFSDPTVGIIVGPSNVFSSLVVSNGQFTVVPDFGPQYNGPDRWLEIAVRTNGGGSFAVLSPRQRLTPTPYALYAPQAGTAITAFSVTAEAISGSALQTGCVTSDKIANGTITSADLNPSLLTGTFWNLGGNSGADPANGAFIGTSDNLPVELRVNGQRAFRLEPGVVSPNVIGGYSGNLMNAGVLGGFIGGGGKAGQPNRVSGNYASIPGGLDNIASGYAATACGRSTIASGSNSFSAGLASWASGKTATALGTSAASGDYSTAMGNNAIASGPNATAIGQNCVASGINSLAMGTGTAATNDYSTAFGKGSVAGGVNSLAEGLNTVATGFTATAMGTGTIASGDYSTAMGQGSIASGLDSISAGLNNVASGINSFAAGEACAATSLAATALGYHTTASGSGATALGVHSQALHNNTFVWSDGSPATDFASSGANQFLVYASGGMGIGTGSPASALHVRAAVADCEISIHSGDTYDPAGASGSPPVPGHRWTVQSSSPVAAGQLRSSFQIIDRTLGISRLLIDTSGNLGIGTTTPAAKLAVAGNIVATGTVTANGVLLTSDRNAKENFTALDRQSILAKVAALPLTQWNYKTDSADVQHIGPMAQDFHAAFELSGADDKHISVVDEGGVALAAIQGLNQKLNEKDAKIHDLETRLMALEQALQVLTTKK